MFPSADHSQDLHQGTYAQQPNAADETEIIRCMFRSAHQSAVENVIYNVAAFLKLGHETARW